MNEKDTAERAVARVAGIATATLHEAAGRIGALPSAIKPVAPDMRVAGLAYTVRGPSGDNLWLHHAIARAAPGDVLMADVGSDHEFGYWGEVMSTAAKARGLAGLVINGGVRDRDELIVAGLAVFSDRLCIRGTGKDPGGAGALGAPVRIGEVVVAPGDFVVGDVDGVVVLPAARVAEVLDAADRRTHDETAILLRLLGGDTTLDIYGLPPLPQAGADEMDPKLARPRRST
jgi:4-hydroxy-4-methyl-2-oxoglutarate aldolase